MWVSSTLSSVSSKNEVRMIWNLLLSCVGFGCRNYFLSQLHFDRRNYFLSQTQTDPLEHYWVTGGIRKNRLRPATVGSLGLRLDIFRFWYRIRRSVVFTLLPSITLQKDCQDSSSNFFALSWRSWEIALVFSPYLMTSRVFFQTANAFLVRFRYMIETVYVGWVKVMWKATWPVGTICSLIFV